MQTAENAEDVVVDDEVEQQEDTEQVESEEQEAETQEAHDDGEVEITLGDAAAPAAEEEAQAPEWVRELRRENRDLKRQLRANTGTQQADADAPTVGERPKLADYDYDEDKHAEALDKWIADRKKVDDYQAEKQREQEAAETERKQVHTAYQDSAKKLRVSDFRESEAEVMDVLTVQQQGIILAGAENAAQLVYVLGKYPDKLKELASVKNPVKFAFAVAKLERDVKVSPKTKPAPEGGSIGGSGTPKSGGSNTALERLRAEAEKTGDYTKVLAYKRQMRAKS